MAGVLSVSISRGISNVKPCDLEKALESINYAYSPAPCKYDAIKDKTSDLKGWSIGVIIWNSVILVGILCIHQCHLEVKNTVLAVVFFLVSTVIINYYLTVNI